jgi:ABC-type phosphate transport system substrate-binding protein
MATSRALLSSVALALIGIAVASSSLADREGIKIVVNRRNPVASVDRAFLRDVFLKRASRWGNGDSVRPIDLPKALPVRDRFTIDVLNKTPAQLRSYWSQRIFSGTDIPPPEAESLTAAIAYVTANPGAVTYLPADADAGNTKVIPFQ